MSKHRYRVVTKPHDTSKLRIPSAFSPKAEDSAGPVLPKALPTGE